MDLTPRQDDHEAKMARADLFKLAQYSFKLFKMIHEDQQLEGWVQAKITKAADYIASVYHYMEYEMKFSEYGEKLENSDVYHQMSESQRIAIENMLTEAKETMKKLTAAQAKKLKKKDDKVEEGFPTVDDAKKRHEQEKGTGKFDKKETGTGTVYTRKSDTFTDGGDDSDVKAAKKKEKKVKEGFPTVADAKARHEKEKGTGKFDKKEVGDGRTRYTRKSDTFTDGGDDSDVKAAKKKAKKTDESAKPDFLDMDKDGNKKEPMKKAVADKKKNPFAKKTNEALKGGQKKLDVDKDGDIEADDLADLRAKKKEKKVDEAAKCNHTAKGKSCPVHGMKECSGMYEAERKAAVKPSAGLSAAKKSSIVKKAKAGGDIGKPGKGFAALASKAGGGEKGKKIAAAAMWKNAAKESVELKPVVAESADLLRLKELNKILNG